MSRDIDRLQRLLGGEALAPLRQRLARRCLRTDADCFTLGRLGEAERAALSGLLGRRARPASSMRLSLSALDEALARSGLAGSLREALETLDGPLVDASAQRAAEAQRWQAIFDAVGDPRLKALCAGTQGRGLIRRLAGSPEDAASMLERSAAVLERLPDNGIPLARLAAETLGDAHALDNGRPEATVVLKASFPDDEHGEATRARNRWARLGVAMNALARPVLALNLPATPCGAIGAVAAAARAHGEPIHLNLRGLLHSPPRWLVDGQSVYICENPSIIAMAADRLGKHAAPVLSTEGMPAAAQRALLRQLAAAGADLRYHGDYDWDGLRIANFVMGQFGARPWRFETADYLPRPGARKLRGGAVVAVWDHQLAPSMQEIGLAHEEETVAEVLLRDLGE
ncbi:TIGR02679 family protein [Algiphilus sp. NNCM1]|uniref:TIGR02679 family protein n=1 Tax=Algiphilus sp. TaxID=1872431 RepID=UPI001CA731CB|nr:TIGR02679 family protein [Algiphilus sp.]MBY8965959.1 TIGR02679 family protein [Algiphilus acroporae]MCI5062392.1 TIGR02679 family protein [Algiphilus sp.]MCI5102318.1 TIGR02679 family protein [Algiphilus sp.]